MLDAILNWKKQVALISKSKLNKKKYWYFIKTSIFIYYVNLEVLIKLYNSLVYLFLTYAIVAWGNTYQTNIKPLLIYPTKRIEPSELQLFQTLTNNLAIIQADKNPQICLFMYKFHNNRLHAVFDSYFMKTSKINKYKTRLSTRHAYALPKTRTNYGIFSMKFTGQKFGTKLIKI